MRAKCVCDDPSPYAVETLMMPVGKSGRDRFAFVEFTNPESVQVALQYNGAMFGDRPIK